MKVQKSSEFLWNLLFLKCYKVVYNRTSKICILNLAIFVIQTSRVKHPAAITSTYRLTDVTQINDLLWKWNVAGRTSTSIDKVVAKSKENHHHYHDKYHQHTVYPHRIVGASQWAIGRLGDCTNSDTAETSAGLWPEVLSTDHRHRRTE